VKRAAAAALAFAALVPLTSCRGDDGPAPYSLRVDGTAVVTGTKPVRLTDGDHKLAIGDTVRVTRGSATLALPHDASLELRAGRSQSVVLVAAVPTLVDGDGLLVAGDGTAGVKAGAARIELVEGAARLRRSTGVTLAVYQGRAVVEAIGQEVGAPALRQVAVSDTGALPVRAVPFVYDRSDPDPWDVRYLGDAIDLGSQLERRSRAITAQLARTSTDAEYVRAVVPPLRSVQGFDPALVDPERSVGETVVGASIALGGEGEFDQRWKNVFGLRQEGADWGLVALDQRASRSSVFGVLDSVLERVSSPTVTSPPGGGRRPTSTTTPGGGSTTTTTQPGTTTTTPPTTPPTLPPTTEPPDVTDPLFELLGPLLGAASRPTSANAADLRSTGDDGRTRRRGHRPQAVLVGVPGLRPVRGSSVPGSGGDDAGDPPRAREGAPGADRRLRGALNRLFG
jgi:hypothetical protein